MAAKLEVVVGTYEELLLGFRLSGEKSLHFEQKFTDHCHTGCVKCVALSKRGILASGSTDEMIWLYDLKKNRQTGTLIQHTGSLTCLEFFGGTHLFSSGEDGKLCIWKSFTWECLRTFKGHKKGVNCFSVHPSGKLALSVGRDKTLRAWNLVKGRPAYTTNIKKVADQVLWSPSGDCYVLVVQHEIEIYKTETAFLHCRIQEKSRINHVVFINNSLLLYGGEGSSLHFYCIEKQLKRCQLDTGTPRIRGLAYTKLSFQGEKTVAVIASSNGFIKIYDVKVTENSIETALLAEHNTEFRLTCLAVRHQLSKKTVNEPQKIELEQEAACDDSSGQEGCAKDESETEESEGKLSSKPTGSVSRGKRVKRKPVSIEKEGLAKKVKVSEKLQKKIKKLTS